MAENEKSNGKKAPKRINKLTNARIKKEIEFLAPMFAGIDDEDKNRKLRRNSWKMDKNHLQNTGRWFEKWQMGF